MRVVIQRVSRASVRVDSEIVGEIGQGALILAGVKDGDTEDDVRYIGRARSPIFASLPTVTSISRVP